MNICIYTNFEFLFLQVINKTYIWHHQLKADLQNDGWYSSSRLLQPSHKDGFNPTDPWSCRVFFSRVIARYPPIDLISINWRISIQINRLLNVQPVYPQSYPPKLCINHPLNIELPAWVSWCSLGSTEQIRVLWRGRAAARREGHKNQALGCLLSDKSFRF